MKNFRSHWRMIVQALLFSAAALLVCGVAQAQTNPVNGFVVVNPIVVCDSNGNCPPFGVQCSTNTTTLTYSCTQFNSPSLATVNTPIGFVDGDTNTNLTRAILAGEAGIDVAFFPVVQYKSPNTNTDPWPKISPAYSIVSPNLPNYQHLHIKTVTCKDGTPVQASPDLAALTQHQICTEHKGVPTGVSNPPPAPSPPPPLGTTLGRSNALDLFFISDFDQAVFGLSWINGDGVAIAGPPTFLISGPRFDNLAHEIGHALALDHTTFGIQTTDTNNLMMTGSSRIVPSTSGCAPPSQTTQYFKFPNPNGGALYDLGDLSVYLRPSFAPCPTTPANPPIADQLTPASPCTDLTTCANQVGALSLSPFINKTLASTASAGGGTQAAVVGAATTSSSTPSNDVPFKVNATSQTGENGDSINSIIIALPNISGLSFNGSTPASQTGGTSINPLNPCDAQHLNNCAVTITSQLRLNGNNGIGNPNCVKSINLAPPSVQCLQIFFSTGANAFVEGDFITFNLSLNKDFGTISQNNLLNDTQFTVITSTANTPAAYSTTSTGSMINGVFTADSRFPDFTIPNQISPDFVSAAVVQLGPQLSKCTPPYTGSGPHLQCPGGSLPKTTACPPAPQPCLPIDD